MEIVDDQIADHVVDARITGPVVEFDGGEVEGFEERLGNDGALGDDFRTHVVLNALAGVAFGEGNELFDGDVEEVVGFLLEIVFDLLEFDLVGCFLCTRCFVDATEEALVDDHTGERGVGLEGGVFHVHRLCRRRWRARAFLPAWDRFRPSG